MGEPFVTLYHGTTLLSAQSIKGEGICKRLYVITDAQLAADYAAFRAAEESADRAVIAFHVPMAIFEQWMSCGSAQEKPQLRPFGGFVLYQATWKPLYSLPATVWTFSENDKMVSHVAA